MKKIKLSASTIAELDRKIRQLHLFEEIPMISDEILHYYQSVQRVHGGYLAKETFDTTAAREHSSSICFVPFTDFND